MLLKFITTIVVTVAILAAPTPDPRGGSKGMAIPLIKHSSSLNAEKPVNIDVLKSHVASHSAKITRGMGSFERNTGMSLPAAVKRDGGAGVDLTNYNKMMWYVIISIGTPAKSFTVQFDTGSSDLFIPASTGDENCRSHANLWDPASSRTAKALNQFFESEFDDDATARGWQYMDNVTIAGFTADLQTFGAATAYSSNMAVSNFPPDGILGLGSPSLSDFHARSPLLHTLFSEGKLPQPVFSLKLSASGGELYVGGINEELYIHNSLNFVPITNSIFWKLKMDNIKVNDRIVLTDVLAIIDTGAHFIFGDPSRVLALHQAYGGNIYNSGYYTFPCSSFPSVTFTIGGKPFLIPAKVLKQGQVTSESPDCFSGIITDEADEDSGDFWTVGTIFLQLFYTVFDFGSEPPRIGFAKLAM